MKQNGFTPILIIVLAAIIAIGGVYYLVQISRTPAPTTYNSPIASSLAVSSNSEPHIVRIHGLAMGPAYTEGQYWKYVSYKNSKPQRGDVVVFKDPQDTSKWLIKRIIGLPEEEIQVKVGSIYINGQLLNEPYITANIKTLPGGYLKEGTVLKINTDEYAVLGDNRDHSFDSRETGFINSNLVIGKLITQEQPLDLPQDKCSCWVKTANICFAEFACQ